MGAQNKAIFFVDFYVSTKGAESIMLIILSFNLPIMHTRRRRRRRRHCRWAQLRQSMYLIAICDGLMSISESFMVIFVL